MKQYYVVDEYGKLQTMIEVNPPCNETKLVDVIRANDKYAEVIRYYVFHLFDTAELAYEDYLRNKQIELMTELKNIALATERSQKIAQEIVRVNHI